LDALFDYISFETDTSIRLIGAPGNRTLTNQTPFRYTDEFNGYGFPTVIALDSNHLLMAVSRYHKVTDWGTVDIVAKESQDNGKTWGEEIVIQSNVGNIQTAAPSLIKIKGDSIGLFFSVKHSSESCDVYFKVSTDRGKNWGNLTKINTIEGYNTMNNNRVIVANKRIIIPVGYTTDVNHYADRMGVFCYYSDDHGKSWSVSKTLATTIPLMEPGVVQIGKSSELLMVIRSTAGRIVISRSNDLGVTWSRPVLTNLISPESPSTICTLDNSDKLALIWNNNKFVDPVLRYSNRFPLTVAFSSDHGRTWEDGYNVEWLSNSDYSYPAFFQNNKKTAIVYNVAPHGSQRILTKMVDVDD
jgi:sialidase-1